MSWLDALFAGYNTVQDEGTPVVQRAITNYGGATVTDDPITKTTTVVIPTATPGTQVSAKVASTSNITLSGTQTIDGVGLSVDDVVLVTGQTAAAENGLRKVATGVWPRTDDALTSGLTVFIQSGTINKGAEFILVNPAPIVPDTTPLIFVKPSASVLVTRFASLVTGGDWHDAIIAAAIAVAGQCGTVQFPNGVFTTSPLDFDQNTGLFGTGLLLRGSGRSKPGVTTGGTVIRAIGSQAYVARFAAQHLMIELMTLDGNFLTTQAVALWDLGTTQCAMRNCFVVRGRADSWTMTTSGDVVTATGNTLANGDEIWFETTSTLFANYLPNRTYFVRDVGTAGAGTFKISATSGGGVFTLGASGSGTESVHKFGTCLMQVGSASDPQADTSVFDNVAFVQDFATTATIGTGLLCWGINALSNVFVNCSFFSTIDCVRMKDGASSQFINCPTFGLPAFSRGAFVLDGFSEPVSIYGHHLETGAMPLVNCVNDPGFDTAANWTITNGYNNTASGDIVWTKRQPLACHGNAMGGFYRFSDVGAQQTIIVGDTFTDQGGPSFHGFAGPLTGVTRIGVSHATTGPLPDLHPNGVDAVAHIAIGANSTGVDIGAASTDTTLTGDRIKAIGELDQSPDTGRSLIRMVSAASTFSELDFNLYDASGYKYSRAGGASAITADITTSATAGDLIFKTAPNGSADAAATLTERMRLQRAGGLVVSGGITVSGAVEQVSADVNNANITGNYDLGSGNRVRAGGGCLAQMLALTGFNGRWQFFTFADGSAGAAATPVLQLQIDHNGDVTIPTRLIANAIDGSGTLTVGASQDVKLGSSAGGAKMAMFGGAGATKQAITGAVSTIVDPAAKAAIQSIIAAFVAYTAVTDGTT